MTDFAGIFAIGLLTGLVGIVLGYAVGQAHIADDCKDFGAFKHGVIYECKEKAK
jgi:hypothetical protein